MPWIFAVVFISLFAVIFAFILLWLIQHRHS